MQLSYNKDELLHQLAAKFKITLDPKIDKDLALLIENKYKIQIEFLDDRIVFSSVIGELLPSRYRTQVFENAMRSNFKSSSFGSLGYSDNKKLLLLLLNYPIIPPNEQEVITLLDGFIAKAKAWTEALISDNTRLLV